MDQRKIRVLLGKGTMDAHDRGVRYLATKLREAGMEVIFMNFLEAKDVLDAAIQEDVDVVGVSSSVEGHLPVARELTGKLRENGKENVHDRCGGVIPERDLQGMRQMGVKGIFGPGSSADSGIEFIRTNVRPHRVPVV